MSNLCTSFGVHTVICFFENQLSCHFCHLSPLLNLLINSVDTRNVKSDSKLK